MDVIYQKNRESRQGIALIMVVGMLALMMVMAVAFAIFMRTERVAAGSFRTDVRARNLLQVALSRAVDAIDASMGTTNYPPWDALYSGGGSYVREALTKNALDQIPLAALTPQGTCVAGAANYVVIAGSVPSGDKGAVINLTDHSFGLITNVVSVGGGNNQVFHTALSGGKNNTWASGVDKYYVLQPAMVSDTVLSSSGGGRFGYVVINCSGLPDANRVGGGVRSIGTNVTEIQISLLPGGVNPALLVSERATPFETHQELIARGMANGVFSGYPDAFVCYSSAVTNSGKVYIGGTVADLLAPAKKAEIIGALTNLTYQDATTPSASFTLLQAETLFTNLIDYVDADRIPGNLNGTCPAQPLSPAVEAVPMANEVVISNVYVCVSNAGGFAVSGSINCRAEYTMPFKGLTTAQKNGFQYGIAVTGVSAAALFNYNGVLVNVPGPTTWGSGGDYKTVAVGGPIVGGNLANLSFTNSTMKCGFSLWVNDSTGACVDTNPVISVTLTPSVQWAGNNATITLIGNKECSDPRLNYDPANWFDAFGGREFQNTLGSTNCRALYYMNNWSGGGLPFNPGVIAAAQGRDGDTAMYVPVAVAGATIYSVGELGYLFFGNMWETVRLSRMGTHAIYGKLHAVLDHFTVDDPAAPTPKGRININTRDADVLAAVFENLSIGKRHSTSATVLTAAQLSSTTNAVLGRSATNGFDSLAELGAIRWELIDPTLNSLEKESILRNTCTLCDVRQNLFTILVYADVTKADITGVSSTLSSVMGVAEVWRDPQGSASHWPASIHSFQIIESQ